MRKHVEPGYGCWCKPVFQHECSACAFHNDGKADRDCWLCQGVGFVECDSEMPVACDTPHVIMHRYPRGTPGACYFLEDA